MIVRAAHDDLQLITQPEHAHLARAIMEHCAQLASQPRRDAILRAIQEHDNGWAEEDEAPTVDPSTGEVVDFVRAPLGVRHAVWPRGVARLSDDPWAAALVAQHAIVVYDRFRTDTEWTSFFTRMETLRAEWLHAAGRGLDDLLPDYAFVRLGDLISLTFCTGWSEQQQFGEWTVQLSGSRVVVSHDPFRGATVPVAIEARSVPRRVYRNHADLRAVLAAAYRVTVQGEVVGKSG